MKKHLNERIHKKYLRWEVDYCLRFIQIHMKISRRQGMVSILGWKKIRMSAYKGAVNVCINFSLRGSSYDFVEMRKPLAAELRANRFVLSISSHASILITIYIAKCFSEINGELVFTS